MDYGLIYWQILPRAIIIICLILWVYAWFRWDTMSNDGSLLDFAGVMLALCPFWAILLGFAWPLLPPALLLYGVVKGLWSMQPHPSQHSEPPPDIRSVREELTTAVYETERAQRLHDISISLEAHSAPRDWVMSGSATGMPIRGLLTSHYHCRSCGNRYASSVQPCPTCGGRVEKEA